MKSIQTVIEMLKKQEDELSSDIALAERYINEYVGRREDCRKLIEEIQETFPDEFSEASDEN